jgi:hypothetical protein
VTSGGFTISAPGGFALRPGDGCMTWFSAIAGPPSLALSIVKAHRESAAAVTVATWDERPDGVRAWTHRSAGDARYEVCRLAPGMTYTLKINAKVVQKLTADTTGVVRFDVRHTAGRDVRVEISAG